MIEYNGLLLIEKVTRYKRKDLVTCFYADIPCHFDITLDEHGAPNGFRFVGTPYDTRIVKRKVIIEMPCQGKSKACKRNTCKCERRKNTYFLETWTRTDTGEPLHSLPPFYRILSQSNDIACKCKHITDCGMEIRYHRKAKHFDTCITCFLSDKRNRFLVYLFNLAFNLA